LVSYSSHGSRGPRRTIRSGRRESSITAIASVRPARETWTSRARCLRRSGSTYGNPGELHLMRDSMRCDLLICSLPLLVVLFKSGS
jgi:hypothetical protein